MDWELINGITGIISAVGAFSGIGYIVFGKGKEESKRPQVTLNLQRLASFTVACSGWALCCLAFLWILEPYGPFVTDKEYQQFFGIILAFPAVVTFLFGITLLKGRERMTSRHKD